MTLKERAKHYWPAYLAKMATFLFSEKIIWERVIKKTLYTLL